MRKKHTAEFKSKVALQAVKGLQSVNEITSQFEVSPTQVSSWKKHFLEASVDTFKNSKERKSNQDQSQLDNLYRKIGQLEIENEFLKKKRERLKSL